jgi:hypothetical protein
MVRPRKGSWPGDLVDLLDTWYPAAAETAFSEPPETWPRRGCAAASTEIRGLTEGVETWVAIR